jgi:hypothetical protein
MMKPATRSAAALAVLALTAVAVLLTVDARSGESARSAFRKEPYLSFDGDAAAMRVHWQLQATAPCTLDWGTDETYSLGSVVTTELEPTHQHERRIDGLDPATLYLYRVRAGDVRTGSFYTAPAPDATAVNILVYGDTRTYPATHDTVAGRIVSAYTADPALQTIALMTGDLIADGNGETYWDNEFFSPTLANVAELHAHVPVASARGNHEGTAALFAKYLPYPTVYGRAWSFDYGPAHVAVVDQYISYSAGSPQLDWLENDLASSDKPWKIVILHEPGWSAGGGHANSTAFQTLIQPLCVEYGVQMVIAGHNHYYAHAVVDGVHHVTAGGGGAPLHTPNPTFPYVVATAKAHHFCTIEIDGGTLVFTTMGKAGQVIDSFTVSHTGVIESPGIPARLGLAPPAPNPSTGDVQLSFTLPRPSRARLSIYDVTGRLVRSLVDATLASGAHSATWDGRDDAGRPAPSGVYFVRAQAGGSEVTQKILSLK